MQNHAEEDGHHAYHELENIPSNIYVENPALMTATLTEGDEVPQIILLF